MATFSLARYKEGALTIGSLRDLLLKTQLITSGMWSKQRETLNMMVNVAFGLQRFQPGRSCFVPNTNPVVVARGMLGIHFNPTICGIRQIWILNFAQKLG
jgi:hypothetical protein